MTDLEDIDYVTLEGKKYHITELEAITWEGKEDGVEMSDADIRVVELTNGEFIAIDKDSDIDHQTGYYLQELNETM
ncbi:MAG: hypothetical protein KME05_15450 [Gloeocapsa sp. UFS-A4-WI-NPMV-4B04]|jgi:hypothetical protein|nr:hypothetical protein [Gloeocapsa sp. UFS-A4-WI-NPMV-4B04]